MAARGLGEEVSLGLRFNYHALNIAGYGKAISVTADVAALFRLSPQLSFGLQMLNAGNTAKEEIAIPVAYAAGLGYDPSDKLCFSAELMKERSKTANAKLSMQYVISPELLVRTIIETDESCCFGAGFIKQRFRLDAFSAYHLRLGLSGGVAVYFFLKKSAGG